MFATIARILNARKVMYAGMVSAKRPFIVGTYHAPIGTPVSLNTVLSDIQTVSGVNDGIGYLTPVIARRTRYGVATASTGFNLRNGRFSLRHCFVFNRENIH